MRGEGEDGKGGGGEAGVEVVGVEDDGSFGVAVSFPGTKEAGEVVQVGVFEVDVGGDGDKGCVAGNIDDSNGAVARGVGSSGRESREEEFDKEERGEIVGLPLGLVAVFGQHVRRRHDAGIIDQNVEAAFLRLELLDRVDYTGKSEEIRLNKVQIELLLSCGGFLHFIHGLCRFLCISSEDIHACST